MVRLKGPEWITLLMCIVIFNSTMVRLKEFFDLMDAVGGYFFQFHYGTIKSP